MKYDRLWIEDLEVYCRIGVPDQERRKPQKLWITVEAQIPCVTKAAQKDSIEKTVDYFLIYQGIERIVQDRPRKLLETLAEEIATYVLQGFPVPRVKVMVKKFIFKNTRHVAIQIERRQKK